MTYHPFDRRAGSVPKTNTKAIVSVPLAVIVAPLGILFGVLAKREIRRTGEDGSDLATAGIVVGAALIAITVLLIVAWVMFVNAMSGFSPGSAFYSHTV